MQAMSAMLQCRFYPVEGQIKQFHMQFFLPRIQQTRRSPSFTVINPIKVILASRRATKTVLLKAVTSSDKILAKQNKQFY